MSLPLVFKCLYGRSNVYTAVQMYIPAFKRLQLRLNVCTKGNISPICREPYRNPDRSLAAQPDIVDKPANPTLLAPNNQGIYLTMAALEEPARQIPYR